MASVMGTFGRPGSVPYSTAKAAILGFTAVFTKDFLLGGAAISFTCFLGITALSFLELLVAVIQAFVFTFLTTVFLAGAVHPEH